MWAEELSEGRQLRKLRLLALTLMYCFPSSPVVPSCTCAALHPVHTLLPSQPNPGEEAAITFTCGEMEPLTFRITTQRVGASSNSLGTSCKAILHFCILFAFLLIFYSFYLTCHGGGGTIDLLKAKSLTFCAALTPPAHHIRVVPILYCFIFSPFMSHLVCAGPHLLPPPCNKRGKGWTPRACCCCCRGRGGCARPAQGG